METTKREPLFWLSEEERKDVESWFFNRMDKYVNANGLMRFNIPDNYLSDIVSLIMPHADMVLLSEIDADKILSGDRNWINLWTITNIEGDLQYYVEKYCALRFDKATKGARV